MSLDIRRDKKIDPNQLDVECVQQADLFYDYAELLAEAEAAAEERKFKMEATEASVEIEVRQNPGEFKLTKPTESSIKAATKLDSRYERARRRYIKATKEMKLLRAAVSAMEMKKSMLKELVQLHGQQYFAGPSIPRNLVVEWTEHQKRIETQSDDKVKRHTRKRGEESHV